MEIRELAISGAWVFTPVQHGDARGVFLEAFKAPMLSQLIGHDLDVAQVNVSVSSAGTLRGIHFADVPPGQAKYVTCVAGAILDVIVDIRGKGLLIGIKVVPNNREFMVMARDQHLLIAGGGDNCVRLLPPLNLTVEEASEAISKLEKACEVARAKAAA